MIQCRKILANIRDYVRFFIFSWTITVLEYINNENNKTNFEKPIGTRYINTGNILIWTTIKICKEYSRRSTMNFRSDRKRFLILWSFSPLPHSSIGNPERNCYGMSNKEFISPSDNRKVCKVLVQPVATVQRTSLTPNQYPPRREHSLRLLLLIDANHWTL